MATVRDSMCLTRRFWLIIAGQTLFVAPTIKKEIRLCIDVMAESNLQM